MFCVLIVVVTDEIKDVHMRVHKFTYAVLNKEFL